MQVCDSHHVKILRLSPQRASHTKDGVAIVNEKHYLSQH